MPSKKPHEVQVGDGATMSVGSDRYPYTVLKKSATGNKIYVAADEYRRTDTNGQSEDQTYEFIPATSWTGDKKLQAAWWAPAKGCYLLCGSRLAVGHRSAYKDPSF